MITATMVGGPEDGKRYRIPKCSGGIMVAGVREMAPHLAWRDEDDPVIGEWLFEKWWIPLEHEFLKLAPACTVRDEYGTIRHVPALHVGWMVLRWDRRRGTL